MQRALSKMIAAALGVTPVAAAQASPSRTPAPILIVQAQVDAFNKGDLDAFASFYAEDVELFDLGPEAKPNLSGRAALIERYKPILTKYHPKATILSRMEADGFVIDKERTEASGKSSEGVAIYQVEFGKIRRIWFTP
ncbi:hypothetical protein HNO88_003715 [Novosphingobium chloroacetimidivorans]|uniref:SnoaL-like domain-containing protein n=1 Tax=Novosphingobium chloroacetimidivorans TaxID=1428314 RepID=A0A7W7KCN8_9SPHN|nr:nuclear transport factor 2 family protein [Novosphingobium chloroacetimidivorans]MBB4860372.1 hypothetical protein [Novosphingobium chloroacetimidivorans]